MFENDMKLQLSHNNCNTVTVLSKNLFCIPAKVSNHVQSTWPRFVSKLLMPAAWAVKGVLASLLIK